MRTKPGKADSGRVVRCVWVVAVSLVAHSTANGMYDPKHGRWLQRDPLGVRPDPPGGSVSPPMQYKDGTNSYEFVKSSPAMGQDAFGLYDRKQCEADVAQEKRNNPIIKRIKAYLDKHNCKEPEVRCRCCNDPKDRPCPRRASSGPGSRPAHGHGGAFVCATNCMEVCLEGVLEPWQNRCTLTHEYVHARQCCKRKADGTKEPSTCEEMACDEIEAAEDAGECGFKHQDPTICGGPSGFTEPEAWYADKEKCVKRAALESVRLNKACKDKKYNQDWIDEQYRRCKQGG